MSAGVLFKYLIDSRRRCVPAVVEPCGAQWLLQGSTTRGTHAYTGCRSDTSEQHASAHGLPAVTARAAVVGVAEVTRQRLIRATKARRETPDLVFDKHLKLLIRRVQCPER